MKGIIIYKGKYGATRQYADWLGKELNLQIAHPGNYIKEYIADGFDFNAAVRSQKIRDRYTLRSVIGRAAC